MGSRALNSAILGLAAAGAFAAIGACSASGERGRTFGAGPGDGGGSGGCSDIDKDTICDSDEGTGDADGDGIPNSTDADADGDGVPDSVEAGDSDPSTPPRDANGDGIPDSLDPATPVPEFPPDDGGGGSGGSGGGPTGTGGSELCPESLLVPTGCITPTIEGDATLCNGLDDDCDGAVDEGCPCAPGAVQPCFAGPPGRRDVGACADGTQRCLALGEFGHEWGTCTGGIGPTPETCDGLDNDCNGCADDIAGCAPVGYCPAPGDPRVPDGAPFTPYSLNGPAFFSGTARSWAWTVVGGPCDEILPAGFSSFTLTGTSSPTATFTPKLSGDYTVTMTVTTVSGEVFTCTWIVHIRGPGLRIEMCYPECTTQDLDLFLKKPGALTPWYVAPFTAFSPAADSCGWHDCEATLRGSDPRADWGYPASPLSECVGGPLGPQWRTLGRCPNPRLDIDNNLSEGIGLPENINVDAPREGETFRIMVENFTGRIARPLVNVYCGGRLTATYGAAPDIVPAYEGDNGSSAIGAMWRVADVTTHLDPSGETICDVTGLHPPGATTGYDVTYNESRY